MQLLLVQPFCLVDNRTKTYYSLLAGTNSVVVNKIFQIRYIGFSEKFQDRANILDQNRFRNSNNSQVWGNESYRGARWRWLFTWNLRCLYSWKQCDKCNTISLLWITEITLRLWNITPIPMQFTNNFNLLFVANLSENSLVHNLFP